MSGSLEGLTLKRRLADPQELCDALGIPFSDQQLRAITAPLSPAVIIAGAGSGKTTVMAARVVWLVGTGAVRPEHVLGLTFTRKAAAELSGRVRAALERAGVVADDGVDEAGEQVVMTYDAFAARLVSEHGPRVGVDSDQTLISGATRYRLAARVVQASRLELPSLSRLQPSSIIERVLQLDAEMQSHLATSADLTENARELIAGWQSAPLSRLRRPYADVVRAEAAAVERLELAALVEEYQRLKAGLRVVEFADQMATAARLVTEVPIVSELVRDQFRVVLLDEYQDTSAAQAQLLRGLFSGPDADHGRGHPVTAVGDPFQAIYGWRGAAASNILQFATEFPTVSGAPAAAYPLTVNRRSGQTILDVANEVAKPLRRDPLLADAGAEVTDTLLEAPDDAGPGEVRAATFATWPDEIAWLCDTIVAAHATGEATDWADMAVLCRRNADIGAIFAALSAREVPVEIVGLGGLLKVPEVRDVVCTLELLDDVTANPALIRLLSGPRWAIGPADLALLGRRARALAAEADESEAPGVGLAQELEGAVADIDPAEVTSLLDAVSDPGDLPYSAAAGERLAAFAHEMTELRSHSDEPVLDLVRRVVTVLGLDVELLATPEFARTGRRNQLATFIDAVADYVDVDGDASLAGLMAYLRAEERQGIGLERAVPSDQNSVKLLTVHKAKGLEWPMVFLPALVKGVFPSDRVTDNWVTTAAALPADLRGDREGIPALPETTNDGIKAHKAELKDQQIRSEDRLGYVAVTRAKQVVIGSGHTWRAGAAKPRVPSNYLTALVAEARAQGRMLAEAPPVAADAVNPLDASVAPCPWPAPLDPDAASRRQEAAAAVTVARERAAQTGQYGDDEPLLLDHEARIAQWDADIDTLLLEARERSSGVRVVDLPPALSASQLLSAWQDDQAYAARLLRPMPRRPSAEARFGTRFHRWIERHYAEQGGTLPLIDPDDGLTPFAEVDDDADYRELCRRFSEGAFSDCQPHALESPFTLNLAGLQVRGRIDAVFAVGDAPGAVPTERAAAGARWLLVDFKTSRAHSADPDQLAIYRLAWAQLMGCPVDAIDAAFHYVRDDRVVRPASLPDEAELVARLRFA